MSPRNFIALCACVLLAAWAVREPLQAAAQQAAGAERISLTQARFAVGDDKSRAALELDDQAWKLVNTARALPTLSPAEAQEAYRWYRFHVVIPSKLKAASDWPERLRLQLPALADAEEVFLNGELIGSTGRMPDAPGGFESRTQATRDYLLDLRRADTSGKPLVRWDQNNVIALRLYEHVAQPSTMAPVLQLSVPWRAEGVRLDTPSAQHRFDGRNDVFTTVVLHNRFPVLQTGELRVDARDHVRGRFVLRLQQRVQLAAQQRLDLELPLPSRPGLELRVRFIDRSTTYEQAVALALPYLLTPDDGPSPALHGASVLGARPGTPLHHRIAATGQAPMRFTAEGLPPELSLNAETGLISGTVPAAGRYAVKVQVSNSLGTSSRNWTLVAGEQLALTPPMGWSSWHSQGLAVTDASIRSAARGLQEHGLAAKGWTGVHIDDGWQLPRRTADGNLRDPQRFPDMPGLAKHLHQQGLRLGLYATPDATSCAGLAGNRGHEERDVEAWAAWGVDHVKFELCSHGENRQTRHVLDDHQRPFRRMGQLLRQQPRSIVYGLSQFGEQRVWSWGAKVGAHSWRTTGDIQDSWPDLLASGFAMAAHTRFTGPGRYNDPDALMLGHLGVGAEARPSRLTPDEQYSQVTLWSLLSAPLMLASDLARLDDFTRSLLTNSEVIDIHQDPLARSARRVLDRNGWQVWVKELEDGGLAVGIFNMSERLARYDLDPALLGRSGQPLRVRDAWRQQDMAARQGAHTFTVPAHGVALLTVR